MRRFLVKLSLYALSVGLIFGTYFCVRFSMLSDEKFSFVSNSISCNAKAKFLGGKDFSSFDYFIMGSSLSLNNIDGPGFEQRNSGSALNLSSWGMKLIDYKEFLPLLPADATIVMSIGFTDFGTSALQRYDGYPVEDAHRWKNILFHLRTYNAQLGQIGEYTGKDAFRTYNNLNFDKTGSVLLNRRELKISKIRWENSPQIPTEQEQSDYLQLLGMLGRRKVYIFFGPERHKYKSEQKNLALERLKKRIEDRYDNIRFFNNYQLDFDDSMFVDCTHFSKQGAEKYTQVISEELQAAK